MQLVAFTPVEFGDVYLDVVKAGQTLSTRSAKVEDGKAEFAIDVSADLYGTLELHAYKVLLDGTIVRDTRLVVVDEPRDIDIAISSDQDTYLPGEAATIDFQTTDASQGGGVQTALGLAIVDESVFALQRQDPGFAKLYFLLEQELMEPFYQIKGFEVPTAIAPDEDVEQVRLAQDSAAKATWASAPVLAAPNPVNSRGEKIGKVYEAQRRGFERIGQASAAGLILLPLLLWVVVAVALYRSGIVRRSLVRVAVASGILLAVGLCLGGWFIVVTETYYYLDPEQVLLPLAVLLGLVVLGFVVYAWAKRDPAAKFLSLLTLAWPALFFLLILASDEGGDPPDVLIIGVLLAFLLLPGAYLLFGQARWVQKRRWGGGLATVVGGLAAIPALLVVPMVFLLPAGMGAGGALGRGGMEDWAEMPVPEAALMVEEVMVEAEVVVEREKAAGDEMQAAGEAPRLRQYFPETLYWAPEVLTDESGFVSLEIPMADSITTWRLTALASSQDGRLGFTTRGIRVFQDFFVDIDLPVSLTQGDEISIPVGVFNYLPEAQEVRLEVEAEPWFELLDEGEQTLIIGSNDIEVVYFPIRVLRFGRRGFQVTAWGEQMSDAIRREVDVLPDGKEIRLTESDWLRESKELQLTIPPEAVPETPFVEVKVYPGVMAQAVEGLEKILRMPHG
jgi:hypothetical protein